MGSVIANTRATALRVADRHEENVRERWRCGWSGGSGGLRWGGSRQAAGLRDCPGLRLELGIQPQPVQQAAADGVLRGPVKQRRRCKIDNFRRNRYSRRLLLGWI